MQSRSTLMTEGAPWRHIVWFALPLLLGNLFQQLYNVVDSLVVGNVLGSDALAAVGSSSNVIHLMIGLFNGTFTGAGVVISRYFGARDDKKLSVAVHTTVAFGLVCGAVITVAGVALVPTILVWMGTPQSVMPDSVLYFRIYFGGVIFTVLYNTAKGIFQAVGDSRHPLYYLILSSVINVALDVVLVAGLGMGVDGAAYATVISQAISAFLAFRRLMHTTGAYRIWPSRVRFDLPMLRELLTMGIPSGIQNSIISIANVVVQSSINVFGAAAMAGCGAYAKISDFALQPIISLALAISTFVGQNLGAREHERARKGAKFGILTAVILAQLTGLAIYAAAPWMVGLFNQDPQVIAYGTLQARTLTWFYFLLAFSHAVAGVMRGAGRAIVPMVVMMISWCMIRVAYITLIARASGDIRMVFWAYPITWGISSLIFLIYYLKADWPHELERKAARLNHSV